VRILTNFTYLPCDHFALLGRESIVPFESETIAFFGRTSSQSWFLGLLVEIVDLWKNLRALIWKLNVNLQEGRLGLRKSLNQAKKEAAPMLAKAVLIAGDFPLSINYSLKKQFLSPLTIGVLGTTSSIAALYLRWIVFRKTEEENKCDTSEIIRHLKDAQ
jgi:hypothetical protein